MMKVMVEIKDLKKGMYVSELDRPWLETPFLFQGFRITNMQEIEQLSNTCNFVYVDPEKSVVPVPQKSPGKFTDNTKKDQPEIKRQRFAIPYQVEFEHEFPKAKKIYQQSIHKMERIINDTRSGSSLNANEIKSTVVSIADSVIRNPDALMLLSVLESKDDQAVTHSINVCTLSLIFGRYIGLEKKPLYELGTGALMHDIGETKVPTEILYKREKKTPQEVALVQEHTRLGVELLKKSNGLPPSALEIARDHHERMNGSGYPQKLSGDQLGLFTKIVAITDVYDSVTSGLYGKQVITCTEALKNMYVWREELFDSLLVEQFIQCLGIYPIGSTVELNSGEIGIVINTNPERRLLPRVMLVRDQDKRPYEPPKIINLAQFCDDNNVCKFEIRRVVKANLFSIDVRNYILRELDLKTA
jgi:HD-GYP domain-containing protein (c-di-GMP phosphodiesterase class II)